MRVLSFGGFIIQLSRSLLSTWSRQEAASFRLSTNTAAAAGEENVASNVASTTAALRDYLLQARSGSLSAGIIVRSWSLRLNSILNDNTDRLTLIVCLLCEHQSWVGRPACEAAPPPAESQNSSHRQKAAQDIARGGY